MTETEMLGLVFRVPTLKSMEEEIMDTLFRSMDRSDRKQEGSLDPHLAVYHAVGHYFYERDYDGFIAWAEKQSDPKIVTILATFGTGPSLKKEKS